MSSYIKPANVRYIDMVNYIDQNVYREDLSQEEEERIYEYMYHVAKMLASKGNYFRSGEYYDDFAIFVASKLYLRYKNPNQFILDKNGIPKLKKIDQFLGYIKSILPLKKVDFEQQFYSQQFSQQEETNEFVQSSYSLSEQMHNSVDELNSIEFETSLTDIVTTIRSFMKRIPYKYNSTEWNNIYISCLLTFLNQITIDNYDAKRLKNLKNQSDLRDEKEQLLLNKNHNSTDAVLFHLDNKYNDYIIVLTRQLKHAIARDLSYQSHTYVCTSNEFNILAMQELSQATDLEEL